MSLVITGNVFGTRADIANMSTGQPVARISRKPLTARQMLADKQTYVVTCTQGVDMAIIAAMCLSVDERRGERESRNY